MFKPCLLIPVYNHGAHIERTFERLRGFQLPCLLVDDGSDPATATVLDTLVARESSVQLFRLPQNCGKGVAVLHGIEQAARLGFTHAVQIDADGQHDASDIPAMLALARAEPAALVSGWPQYGDDIPRARRYGRWVTHAWVWIETLSFDIKDSMCGFRVYPVAATRALAQRTAIGRRMNFDTDIMVRLAWAGTPVRFVKTRVHYPDDGLSHFDVLRDNLRISWMHTRLVAGMLWRLPVLLARKFRPAGNAQHWASQRERGSYLGMRISIGCYRLFGRRAMNALLVLIVGYFFLANRHAREASRQYLQRLAESGFEPTTANVFRHFLMFGESIVDRLAAWSGDIRRRDVEFTGRSTLLAQAASGRGAVLLTSHLGNVDMCRGLVDSVPGVKLNVLVFSEHARQINRALKAANPRTDLELIPIGQIGPDTAIMLQQKIDQGEFVVIAADRTSPTAAHRVSQVPFLGFPAPFPQGPYILASLLDCPVYLLFALKYDGQYRISLEPFAEQMPLPRRERTALLDQYAARYAERLAAHCRRAPYQWFNFYDFWQDAVPPTPSQPTENP